MTNPEKRAPRKSTTDRLLYQVIRDLLASSSKKGVEERLVKSKSLLPSRTYEASIKRLIASKRIKRLRRPKGVYFIYFNEITPVQLQICKKTPKKQPDSSDSGSRHMYINKKKEKETIEQENEETENQPSFEDFLEAMPRRKDGLIYRNDSERIWNKMVDAGDDLRVVVAGARAYAAKMPEVCTYALTPLRFLSGKVFRDYSEHPAADTAPLGAGGEAAQMRSLEVVWNKLVRGLEDYHGDPRILLKSDLSITRIDGDGATASILFSNNDDELTYRDLQDVRTNLPKLRKALSKNLGFAVISVEVIAPDLNPDDLETIWEIVIKRIAAQVYYGNLATLSDLTLTVAGEIAYLTAADTVDKGDLKDIKKHTVRLRHLLKQVSGVDIRNLIIT